MSKHWYRNDILNSNRLFSDSDNIPNGFSREAYSKYQSDIHTGEKHNNWGKHHSEETKRKISESNKGKKHTEETKKHLSKKAKLRDYSNFHPDHKGKNNPRYGKRYTLSEEKRKSFNKKRYETMKKNNSFNTSKPEEDYYKFLLESYDKDDIVRQYKSDVYPFNCDFYIISEDKYIECNYSWLHGGHPFNPEDPEDIAKLNLWEERSSYSNFYRVAINTWTVRDVNKIKTAKDNNLNIDFLYQY